MFIGREKELNKLNAMYKSDKFELAVVYGRRRVGKSTLIKEFINDKKTVFFTAVENDEAVNLHIFSEAIFQTENKNSATSKVKFQSFADAFDELTVVAQNEPLVVVIDEYPYLADAHSIISSILQEKIDNKFLNISNLMLILCGSSMSFMEHQVLGYQSPLYGRRTAQFKIKPFTLSEAKQMLPRMDDEDFLTIYGVTGGIPLYLEMMDDNLSLKENLIKNFLVENTFLYEEPANLLKQEVRSPMRYNAIVTAIATGSSELNQIVTKTNLVSNNITSYLLNLIELGIIEKKTPLGSIGKKNKTIYEVADGLFNFWYRYVPKYQLLIEHEKTDLIWEKLTEDLPSFTAKIFEQFTKDWLVENSGTKTVPMIIRKIGSWWGKNPLVHSNDAQQEEIDIIALGIEKSEIIIGECKWRNDLTGVAVLDTLIKRSAFFPYLEKNLFIFSKAGFTEDCIELAKKSAVTLLTYKEMLNA